MATGTESTAGGTQWSVCESVIRQFESAWRDSGRPNISDYCTPERPHADRLLVELVHIDLELRLRAGEFARTEDYLDRFPELGAPSAVVDLLAAEFALRARHCSPVWPEELWLRFPEHTAELKRRLPVSGGTGWVASTKADRPGAPLSGPPAIVGYDIQGELGRGGMGVVYKARDLVLHRTVAVKTFATVPRPQHCARFAREAEAIAQLDHAHIVPIYEVGEWRVEGAPVVPFFVMKWYPGGSLDAAPAGPRTRLRTHAITVETIARAVHHAHQRGVLHRDLKPSNILLDDEGRPHVADFGLAGRLDLGLGESGAAVVGTPAYMAPEQALTPKEVSTAADVYGLGAILYHQLTGRAPFSAGTPLATLERVATTPPERPSAINPAVPRDLDAICLKCLEKEPARRYASAAALADDLENWRNGWPIVARRSRPWGHAWRLVRRHPLGALMVATTVGALVVAVAVLADSNEQIRRKREEANRAYGEACAARHAADIARVELQDTLRRERRALYLERVAAAGRLYTSNRLAEAWALLALCPEEFRGWEWRYLDALRRAKAVTLVGHTAQVARAGFLVDGRLVSADTDGVTRVWDVGNQKVTQTWEPEAPGARAVTALAVHPQKNWIAVAGATGAAVRDADTGRTITRFPGAHWVAFSPDGSRIVTAEKGAIRLWAVPTEEPKEALVPWDRGTWQPVGALVGHDSFVDAGVFSSDGKHLVTSSSDCAICTWDVENRKLVSTRPVPNRVTGLALALEGKVLAEAHAGAVIFTDLATGQLRDRLEHPIGEWTAVSSAPDQRTVAVSGPNGEVVVWDVSARRADRVFRGHAGRVSALAFDREHRLASGGVDRTVCVWDANAEQGVRTLVRVGDGVGGLAVSPDGAQVAVGPRMKGTWTDAKAGLFDAATGRPLRQLACWPDLGFHPTTGHLVTNRRSGGASVWDVRTGREVWTRPIAEPRGPREPGAPLGKRVALSRDGSVLAVWDRRAGGVQLWDPADGASLGVIPTGEAVVHGVDLAPDGERLVVAASDALTMWDVRELKRVPWGEGVPRATSVAFSPNGLWVATADDDNTVRLLAAETGAEVRRLVGTALRVETLCFSSDGARLVTGGADRTVRLWDVETGRELLSLPGLTEGVTGLAWDEKNDRVFALDVAVRVWETRR